MNRSFQHIQFINLLNPDNFGMGPWILFSGLSASYGRLGNLTSSNYDTRSIISTTSSNVIGFNYDSPYKAMLSSDGGVTYIELGPTFSSAIDTVAWSGSVLSICGSTTSWYSSNMVSFTQSGTVSISGITRACWGPSHSLFIYCCSNGQLGYSDDNGIGIKSAGTYYVGVSGIPSYFRDIIWVPQFGRYVAVSSNASYTGSTVRYSSNGTTWTTSNNLGTFQTRHNYIAYSQTLNRLVAMGNDLTISDDGGLNWSTYTNPITSLATTGISLLKWIPTLDMFVAVNPVSSDKKFWVSRDGINWTYHSNYRGSMGSHCEIVTLNSYLF